ncbi:alpha/beta hydrolase family protein [Pelagerythrobacter rhizovicinus]|uniref:Lipase family protein n=1 Tax=Pelagerythrobacter rhizovicinus TaxID=2268576 RepID=A0A4Q2KMH5_9SPHN|nr:hypothetical protein [Pelagerythrobacter rhizovicinus]RXZ65699.1 hypothetical protein ETX26_02890 [Pelagerythrobacter rhizovicinus]
MARALRACAGAGAALLFSACATTDLSQARSPCVYEPGGWCGFTRELAAESWQYAQLANNSYKDEEELAHLPGDFVQAGEPQELESGYAYVIYDRHEPDDETGEPKLAERVIAFRGTEMDSFDDWVLGNIGELHNDRGWDTYAEQRKMLDEQGLDDVPIRLTGHSLGGAIAAYVALREARATSYAFNQSPRFSVPEQPTRTRRLAVSERGEALRSLPAGGGVFLQDALVVNCRPNGAPWKDHSIRKLAECLTWIAAYGDPRALESVRKNAIPKPPVECGPVDKEHPGDAPPEAVCRHHTRIGKN